MSEADQLDQDQTKIEGFCTCLRNKDGSPILMRDCGLSTHRVKARMESDRRI